VIVGAALSGSVLVFSLWPPLSASQRGIAVIILSAVLAFHFLLAAGLQLYFFRYSNNVVVVSNNIGGISHGNLRAVDSSTFDKVTELQPLSLIGAFEDYSTSGTSNAEPTIAKTMAMDVKIPATAIINNTNIEQETVKPEHVANSTTDLEPKKDQIITKPTKLLRESTTVV
jgi:hypothetical protein